MCKNQNCKHDFCWVCLGSWEPHGSSWYNCNRYDEDEAKAARDAQEKLRSSLARYLHYYNRYMNHMQSLKFENKLYTCIKEKMEEMQLHNMSWIEVCCVAASRCKKNKQWINRPTFFTLGTIFEACRWHSMPMPSDFDVHLCICILFEEE